MYFIRILDMVFASSSITSHRAYSHVFPSHSRKGVWHILCTLHYLVPVQVGEGGGAGGGSIKSCFSRGGKTPKDSNESDCVAKTN